MTNLLFGRVAYMVSEQQHLEAAAGLNEDDQGEVEGAPNDDETPNLGSSNC